MGAVDQVQGQLWPLLEVAVAEGLQLEGLELVGLRLMNKGAGQEEEGFLELEGMPGPQWQLKQPQEGPRS